MDKVLVRNFTLEEYSVLTKISNNPVKLFIPREIIEFISSDEYSSNNNNLSNLFDEEKITILKESLIKTNCLDLRDNPSIQDTLTLKALLAILGSVNSKNDFTQYTTDDYLSNIESYHYIENFIEKGYVEYIKKNLEIIFGKFKMKDLSNFIKAARNFGINVDYTIEKEIEFHSENKSASSVSYNVIYQNIRNFIQKQNKILIVVTPSNNFWIKSEKYPLGTKLYDRKLNNYSYIYYNWPLIQLFYNRIASHPRCFVAFLNSMNNKNLKSTIDCIPLQVKNFTNYIIFDQNSHTNTNQEDSGKPIFIRDMEKIINVSQSYEGACFNETNILILESEIDKVGNTKSNMIPMNVFSEEFFTLKPEEFKKFDEEVEKVFVYIETLLNECDCDIREYLTTYPINC